jgi:hypothetical protein
MVRFETVFGVVEGKQKRSESSNSPGLARSAPDMSGFFSAKTG